MKLAGTPFFGQPHPHSSGKQWSSSLEEKLSMLPSHRHTIYRVYNGVRDLNREAYEPKHVAIGPYHTLNQNLQKMEAYKLRYLKSFLEREGKSIEDCISAIASREREARDYYAEPINLDTNKFVEMLVLDGCFIIELLLRRCFPSLQDNDTGNEESEHVFNMMWLQQRLARDILLFENQIPLFVILDLFNLGAGFPPKYGVDVGTLITRVFKEFYPCQANSGGIIIIGSSTEKRHLLGLIYRSLVLPREYQTVETKDLQLHSVYNIISCATTLAQCNVRFERKPDASSMFEMNFENGCMQLPPLVVDEDTETVLRNLMAYEQYFQSGEKHYVTCFAILMDGLIDSGEDVKLLVKSGIIENGLGSDESVANVFNKLIQNVSWDSEYFIYTAQVENVRKHCSLRRNKWMATLKRNHLNSPWRIISLFAGFVLIVLTLLQTVFTIIKN